MTEENNKILISMRRTARFGVIMRCAYWAIIIGLSIGAFYFIQPYINFMTSTLGIGNQDNAQEVDGSSEGTSWMKNFQELMK